MSKISAYQDVLNKAIIKLKKIDLTQKLVDLGLSKPKKNKLKIRAFGENFYLNLDEFEIKIDDKKKDNKIKISDKITILHYLLSDVPIIITGKLINFRDLSGGNFYWQPFLSRTINPLIKRIGNNLDLLKNNLNRFDWEKSDAGDFSAKIHIIGKIYIILVYFLGDEEFQPDANILFDDSIKNIFDTEDVAVLSSRICLSLL